jgi:lipoprotein-releasing system permease protein
MAIPYEVVIGTRYLRSTQRRGFLSFISLVSMLGLALGVAVLIVVLSVMNGFERELRTRMLAVTSHATIMGLDGALDDWQDLQQKVRGQPGVQAAVPYLESQAMFANGRRMAGANVRGVLPEQERTATGLAQRVIAGSLDELKAGAYGTILGSALAHELNVRTGDSVVLIAPAGTATPTGVVPRMRRFRVVGIFESGMYEFDRGLALVNMQDAARLFRSASGATGLRLAFTDPVQHYLTATGRTLFKDLPFEELKRLQIETLSAAGIADAGTGTTDPTPRGTSPVLHCAWATPFAGLI